MKILALLLLAIWAVSLDAVIDDADWLQFKRKFGKIYKDADEEALRFEAYKENQREIEEHNDRYQKGETTFSMGINQYSDMTYEEFADTILMKTSSNLSEPLISIFEPPRAFAAPTSVDWRIKGYVTPVKDQGKCGSCYAFSATGGLEGQHFKKTRQLVSLSEQNIVDCSSRYGNEGCNGGYLEASYYYIANNHGIDTEKSYPYRARKMICTYSLKNRGATCTGYRRISPANENDLRDAVASVGPIPSLIYVSNSFVHYKQGIYYGYDCPAKGVNHAILIVGYGSSGGKAYWIVKNSWGRSFGEDGYIRMSRNRSNNCQIASNAVYPIV